MADEQAADILKPEAILARLPRGVGKRTPGRAVAVLTALQGGASRRAAAAHAGIDDNTLWRWMGADDDFRQLVEVAEGAAEMAMTTRVYAASTASWQAAAWWLERRRPKEYGRRDRMEVSVEMRDLAQSIAAEHGLDADELIAESQRIIAEARERNAREP